MKGLSIVLLTSLVWAGPAGTGVLGDEDFTLVKKDKVVSLYERWTRDANGGKTREVKATFLVRCTVDAATRLLMDAQKGKDWNVNAKSFSVLSLGVANQWITYIRYGIPWPIGDQDCCLRYSLHALSPDGKRAEVHFESTEHDRFPVNNKITRITGTQGKWLLETEGVLTRVTYFVSTRRSSKVPRWVSDPLVRNNLFETMTAFKNILEK